MSAAASPARELRPCRVRVPGSTSNLGAGFDCVGLAVDRELTASFEPGGSGLELRRGGTLEGLRDPLDGDLLVAAFRRELTVLGWREPGGRLEVRSEIPVARGLGSSAAAVVAGVALARLAAGRPIDAGAAFRAAAAMEGHGDNAAPSAFGGLRAVVGRGDRMRSVRLDLSADVGFGYAAPPVELSTGTARDVLPASVPFRDAAEGIGRTVALIRGLATGDAGLLGLGLADTLHAPHRLALIPGAREAVEAAREAGAWGVTVSGAGSGLLAVGPAGEAAALAGALARGLAEIHPPDEIAAFPLHPVRRGVRAADARS